MLSFSMFTGDYTIFENLHLEHIKKIFSILYHYSLWRKAYQCYFALVSKNIKLYIIGNIEIKIEMKSFLVRRVKYQKDSKKSVVNN